MWPTSITVDGVPVPFENVLAELVIRHGRTGAYDTVNAATAQLTLLEVERQHTADFAVGVELVIRAGTAAGQEGPNLLAGDFTAGLGPFIADSATGGAGGGGAVATLDPDGANAPPCGKVTATAAGAWFGLDVWPPLPVVAGRTYRLRTKIKAPAGSGAYFGADFYSGSAGSWSWVAGGPWPTPPPMSGRWLEIELDPFTVPAGVTGLVLGGFQDGATGWLALDDVELREILVAADDAPRFTGTITDASLDDDALTVIAAGPLSTLSSSWIGDVSWPSEKWSDRVTRAFAEAGQSALLELQFDAGFDPPLVARGDGVTPPTPVDLLSYLGQLADDVAAAVVDLPDGRVLVQQLTYRTESGVVSWVSVPAAVLWSSVNPATSWDDADGLAAGPLPVLVVDPADVAYVPVWEQALTVENVTTVGYGDQQAVTVTEQASRDLYGEYPGGVSTQLANLVDATTRADERSRRLAYPRWVISSAAILAGLDVAVGQIVDLEGFPPASPHASWRPILEGWTDTLRGDAWNMELALSDAQLSGIAAIWLEAPGTWAAVDPACAWNDAGTLDAIMPASLKRLELV